MTWGLSARIDLRNNRVSDADADRQTRTAEEILCRLENRPGVILADEVGMGKTYVALAVAASVLECTDLERPVVVMVPLGVADKWPTEWAVFAEKCLAPNHGLRAVGPVRRGIDLLKHLDDPPATRNHVIFMTHGALASQLLDPFVRLALLRQAMLRRSDLAKQQKAVSRFAGSLLNDRRFDDQPTVEVMLTVPPSQWMREWNRRRPNQRLSDDPVPRDLLAAVKNVDLSRLRDTISQIPINRGTTFHERIQTARRLLDAALKATWAEALRTLNVQLPLLVLDEAHHLKNPNQLSKLFANKEAEQDAEALQGPLGNMFERMLFLTATPFQLGHHELLSVLDRFHGIRWPSVEARELFDEELSELGKALDRAQGTALRLERAWSRIDAVDAPAVAALSSYAPCDEQPEAIRTALAIAAEALADLKASEKLLKPWVIRHLKPHKAERRTCLTGRGILDDMPSKVGLSVGGAATLPFLLAARAQALAALHGAEGQRSARAYFAFGLASSFEAYSDTRRNRVAALDDLDALDQLTETPAQLRWYLEKITDALPRDTAEGWATHPKINATVDRVLNLWRNGEKALIFCFYVETGRALRSHVSRALRKEIVGRAMRALEMESENETVVLAEVERIGERLLRTDSRGYAAFRKRVEKLAAGLDDQTTEGLAEVAVRFMRTPSFLVRFVDLSRKLTVDGLLAGFDHADLSGSTLAQRIEGFARTLEQKVDLERYELLAALQGIQTGGIGSTAEDFDPSERSQRREVLLPNVRLANGGVKQVTRRRLMLTFNTPFFPEVLVASSVMAEGVDLHQDCRHVIHHDLDWNPSTLEQRTGRIDRIGSKAEVVNQPVVIYEPYLAGTHDEKMFRVVKDRERWFGVVMGETPDSGEWATEREAARVPLPEQLAATLTMDLAVASSSFKEEP